LVAELFGIILQSVFPTNPAKMSLIMKHKNNCRCLWCEMCKAIDRACEKGEHDMAWVLHVVSDRLFNLIATREGDKAALAVALKLASDLILQCENDVGTPSNKAALSDLSDIIKSVRRSQPHGQKELGATTIQ
jgi:hypothetical protein